MTPIAIIFMLLAILIVWGGLAAASVALVIQNRRQAEAESAQAVNDVLEGERG